MSADSEMSDLTGSSELLRLLEIEFEEVGPARVSGSVAAAECHPNRGGSCTAACTRP